MEEFMPIWGQFVSQIEQPLALEKISDRIRTF